MLIFFTKRVCFYLLFTLMFSSTLKADRMKNLDSYYNDVKNSAEQVGNSLKNVKSYMDEIYKPNYFPKKTFLGVKPRWYTANHGYYTFTTEYPYQIKNTTFKKKIRNIYLETDYKRKKKGYISLYMYQLKFLIKDSSYIYENYRNKLKESLEKIVYPSSNINQILFELEEYENKIRSLVERNIYMNVKKLSENIHHTDKNFMKTIRTEIKPFNTYDKDDEIIESHQNKFKLRPLVELFNNDALVRYGKEKKLTYANSYTEALEQMISKMYGGKLKIEITINNHRFNIVSHSKEDFYNKESKFIAILDEYEKNGICYKFSPKKKPYQTIYQSLNDKGYILYERPMKHFSAVSKSRGYWATSIWSSQGDLFKTMKNVEDEYENFVKLANEYHQLALERIIDKYTDKSESNKGFGNEF